jgi:hypothetical protein|tara:strand:+ start:9375 stop:9821 length:447 start_codon:yes stop_codon:yes gene_type:complete
MAYATIQDLLDVDPHITEYGVLEFDAELARSEQEINRLLSVRWFPSYNKGRTDIRYSNLAVLMDETKLDPTQWTKATVFHALAYHICPKLTKFEAESDRFREMMDYYRGRFEDEFDLCLRQGVRYDANDDNVFQDVEKTPDVFLRLRR